MGFEEKIMLRYTLARYIIVYNTPVNSIISTIDANVNNACRWQ
jgi:hypothetical protein